MPFFNLPQSGTGIPALSGSGAPSNTLGVDGQLYIDTAANTLYGPKAAGAWGSGIPLTGAAWAELTGKPTTFAPSAHTHTIAEVISLQSSLDGKAASAHAHTIASVTGLQTAIDGKAAIVHQHAVADVTGLQTALDAKQATISTYVASVAGRTGAVTLTASDVGLGSVANTTDANKPVSNLQAASDAAVQAFAIQRVNHTGSQTISTVTGLQTALDAKQAAGTYATLVGGQVPASMLPSFVDDVVDVGTTLPSVGETSKIYVMSAGANVNKVYRWSGSVFVEISPSPGTTTDVPEGSNLYFTNARASAAAPVQSVAGLTGAVTLTKTNVDLGNVDNTADVNKPVSAAQSASDIAVQLYATQRANHTGTQLASTISDFATKVVTYAPVTSVNGMTGNVLVSDDGSSFTIPTASDTVLGGVKIGIGLEMTSGVLSATGGGSYSLPTASEGVLGGIKIGTGLTIANGVVSASGGSGGTSYTLPAATAGALGGVKVGTGLAIADGVLSATGGGSSGTDARWDYFKPPAPSTITAVAGDTLVNVSWSLPTVLAQTPITGHELQYSLDQSTWTPVGGVYTHLGTSVVSLLNGYSYWFRAASINGIGRGAWRTTTNAVIPNPPGDPILTTAGLYSRYDASIGGSLSSTQAGDSLVTTSGATVNRIRDQSGFNRDLWNYLGGSAHATLVTAGQNGKNVVLFDNRGGGNDLRTAQNRESGGFNTGNPLTIFAVWKPLGNYQSLIADLKYSWGDTESGSAVQLGLSNDRARMDAYTTRWTGTGTGRPGNWICQRASMNGTGSTMAVNGAYDAPTTAENGSSATASAMNFNLPCCDWRMAGYFQFGELVIFSGALDGTTCSAIETYLMNKWGIT